MNPIEIIARHYDVASDAFRILVVHSTLVTRKALELARQFSERHRDAEVDLAFLEEIGLLHDIGIIKVHAPDLGCHGDAPYLCHGVLGREILEREGFPRHALACERHTGSGITREEVEERGLPIPADRDYLPVTLEEKILCVADKFYGKKPGHLWREKSLDAIERQMRKHGSEVEARWRALWDEIGAPRGGPSVDSRRVETPPHRD